VLVAESSGYGCVKGGIGECQYGIVLLFLCGTFRGFFGGLFLMSNLGRYEG
jgi:hypothetical protein